MVSDKIINLDIVIYKEDNMFAAHCLQLDIVAADGDLKVVDAEISELIKAHIEYTFEHGNWEHFYHPAPQKYWALITERPTAEESSIDMTDSNPKALSFENILNTEAVYVIKRWFSNQAFVDYHKA